MEASLGFGRLWEVQVAALLLRFIKVPEHPSSQHPLRENAAQEYAVGKRTYCPVSQSSGLDPELHCYDVGLIKSEPWTPHLKIGDNDSISMGCGEG